MTQFPKFVESLVPLLAADPVHIYFVVPEMNGDLGVICLDRLSILLGLLDFPKGL